MRLLEGGDVTVVGKDEYWVGLCSGGTAHMHDSCKL